MIYRRVILLNIPRIYDKCCLLKQACSKIYWSPINTNNTNNLLDYYCNLGNYYYYYCKLVAILLQYIDIIPPIISKESMKPPVHLQNVIEQRLNMLYKLDSPVKNTFSNMSTFRSVGFTKRIRQQCQMPCADF
jgi:hypothetical protein